MLSNKRTPDTTTDDPSKTCIPGWRNNRTYYEDPKCIKYPDFCDYMPKPNPEGFAAFTEPYPCHLLTQDVIVKAIDAQDMAVSSMEKCMWDYVISFLFACYPGIDPKTIQSRD